MRKRVTMQAVAEARDAFGGIAQTWSDVASGSRWAKVEPISGREPMVADRPQGDVTHLVAMRFDSTLTVKHRLKLGTRILQIVSIRNVEERGVAMEIDCKELVL